MSRCECSYYVLCNLATLQLATNFIWGAQRATAVTEAVPPDPAMVIQQKSNPYRLSNRFRMT